MIETDILNRIYIYNLRSFNDNLLIICNISENDIVNLRKIVIEMQCDFVISRGFYLCETSHVRSIAKIKPSRYFLNLYYSVYFYLTGPAAVIVVNDIDSAMEVLVKKGAEFATRTVPPSCE